MPTAIELDDDEKAALIAELKRIIAADPFPMSPRVRTLRTILAKLEPFPPKPTGTPSHVLRR